MDIRKDYHTWKRGSMKYKKIKTIKTQTGTCHNIAVSQEASKHFKADILFEVITKQGIFFAKSGCDINGKEVAFFIRFPDISNRILKPDQRNFKSLDSSQL